MEELVGTPEEMIALGATVARKARSGDVFGLIGNMGTGKTHWTKGFLQEAQPEVIVTSPTFNLINEYLDGETPVYHFDFYRIESPEELIALGWDEYLESKGIVVCEWADKFSELMPDHTKWMEFTHLLDGNRRIQTVAKPKRLE